MVIGYIYIYWGREGEGLETELVNKMVALRSNLAKNFYEIITETGPILMRTNALNKLMVH